LLLAGTGLDLVPAFYLPSPAGRLAGLPVGLPCGEVGILRGTHLPLCLAPLPIASVPHGSGRAAPISMPAKPAARSECGGGGGFGGGCGASRWFSGCLACLNYVRNISTFLCEIICTFPQYTSIVGLDVHLSVFKVES